MFWYNGELIEGEILPLNINDPGLLYGATIFTTLRVYQASLDHPLTHWNSHCDRLHQSIQQLGWTAPNWQHIKSESEQLLQHYPVLRITIFSDGREWITGRFLPADLAENQAQGVLGWVANDSLFQRSLATHKTGNYLGAWLALQQARQLAAHEAILIDNQGNWLETSTGNLWGWKANCWWTPSLREEILPGIARSHLFNGLKSQGLKVQENQWTGDFIADLEIIAYSNSVVEVIPFSKILHLKHELNYDPCHPALKQLRRLYFR